VANTATGRLVERHGTPVAGLRQLGLTHVFPSAETLADAELGGLGLTQGCKRAVRTFAEAVTTGAVRLDRSVGLDSLVEALTEIEGVGTSAAQYLALRLGERDACPITAEALTEVLAVRPDLVAASIDDVTDRWRPWRALAATHVLLADRRAPALNAA
jgi:AraC family transcriptional regulator of adaptative response / DNA-3-methyladenine glycosylase II